MEENGRWVNVSLEGSLEKDPSGVVVWCVRRSMRLEIVIRRVKNESMEAAFLEEKGMEFVKFAVGKSGGDVGLIVKM